MLRKTVLMISTVEKLAYFHLWFRLQNSRIFCERERRCRSSFERKVWSECKNVEGEWGETLKTTSFSRLTGPAGV